MRSTELGLAAAFCTDPALAAAALGASKPALICFLEPWSRLGDRNADCQRLCVLAPVKADEPKVKALLIVTL